MQQTHIIFIQLDPNNLYGNFIMQPLPTEILDWADPKDFNLDNYLNDSPIGFFLEIELDYPDELHDLHNDYPLSIEQLEVSKEMQSNYQLQVTEDNNFSLGNNKKLIPNLGNKLKYKLRYQNLKLYLSLGLKIKNCRILELLNKNHF